MAEEISRISNDVYVNDQPVALGGLDTAVHAIENEIGDAKAGYETLGEKLNSITANAVEAVQGEVDTIGHDAAQAIEDAARAQTTADSKIATYYQTTMPHAEYLNVPVNSVYDLYLGDMWYNSDPNVTKTYRYTKTSNGSNFNYTWNEMDIPKDVFDTIDGKRTVFTQQPVPPYALGDLWITNMNAAVGDLYKCILARASGSYAATDWVLATKYTDDTTAQNAIDAAANAQNDADAANTLLDAMASDGKITPSEKLDLKQRWTVIQGEANIVTGSIYLQAVAFTVDHSAFDASYSTLYTYIETTLALFSTANMSLITTVTRTDWDTKWANYYKERTALLNAIASKARSLAVDAQTNVDNLGKTVTAIDTRTTSSAIVSTVTSSTAYNSDLGKGKWAVKRYNKTTTAGTVPSWALISGLTAAQIITMDDGATFTFNADNYIGVASTNILCTTGFTITLAGSHDDGGAIYINGVLVYSAGAVATISKSVTFAQGWNKIDVMWCEQSGGDNFILTTKLSTNANVSGMTCLLSNDASTEGRISVAETSISQNASNISLKVSKDSVISSINQSAESITINAGKINLSGYVTISAVGTPGSVTINGGNITGGTITGSTLKTASATNYVNIQNEYVESYLNGNKVWKFGAIHYDMQGTSRDAPLLEFGRFGDCYINYDNVDNVSGHGQFLIQGSASSIQFFQDGYTQYDSLNGNQLLSLVLDGGSGGVQINPQNWNNGEGGEVVLLGSSYQHHIHLDNLNGNFRVHDGINVGMTVDPRGGIAIERPLTITPNNSGGTAIQINQGGDILMTAQVSGANTNIYNDTGSLNFSTSIGAPGWSSSSDRSLKTDIGLYDEELAFMQVKEIPIYKYTFKGLEYDGYSLGMMVDQAPLDITFQNDMKGINLYSFISWLMCALKVEISKREQLEESFNNLKTSLGVI